jgi:hypothetical protein
MRFLQFLLYLKKEFINEKEILEKELGYKIIDINYEKRKNRIIYYLGRRNEKNNDKLYLLPNI